MPTTIQIKSLADIESSIDELLRNPNEKFILEADEGLSFKITIRGGDWDGLINARIARYVIELQKAFERAQREVAPGAQERQLVKVHLQKGSAELIAKAADILKGLTTNMDGAQQQLVALVFIAVGFAGYTLNSILRHIREKQREANRAKLDGAAVEALSAPLERALQIIDPEKAVRSLAKSMRSEDTIKLPSERAPLSRDEINERFPRKPRVTPVAVMIDDNYKVASIALDTPRVLELERANVSFRAQLDAQLPEEDKESFVAEVKAALESGKPLKVALRINARVGEAKVVDALIVGIGQRPRKDAESLDDIFD